jgi:hypothetical protein
LLVNLAADVERYFSDVAHLADELGELATRSRGAATEREFTFGEGVVGYTTSLRARYKTFATKPTGFSQTCQRRQPRWGA